MQASSGGGPELFRVEHEAAHGIGSKRSKYAMNGPTSSPSRSGGATYRSEAQADDARWSGSLDDTVLLINPNGPLISGGSDGDNGQTGRKLVMDYCGPRVRSSRQMSRPLIATTCDMPDRAWKFETERT